MGAAKLVLGGAILGLFWGGFPRTIASGSIDGLCKSSACICDLHGRLTCDCNGESREVIISADGDQQLSSYTSQIVIRDCPSVILKSSSLASMTGLQSINLLNITNLTLFTESFELSPKTSRAIISIHTASIEILPSFVFRGDMESISFENVHMGLISAFAFANLAGTDILRLENCRIDAIEEQAFKKFDVNYLHVIGGTFGSQVPSRTMNDIEVFTTFRLDSVSMGVVRSSAFVIKKPKTVSIQNCSIDSLEGEAFDISTRGAVQIKNNKFGNLAAGSFLGIRADTDLPQFRSVISDINFTNNYLEIFEEGSIMFDRGSFRPIIDNIFINHACDCNLLSTWKNNILNYTNVYTRFYTGNSLLQSTFLEPVEEGTFLCSDDATNNAYISFREFQVRSCALNNSTIFFLLILVAVLFILFVAVILTVWWCKKHRNHDRKRWISVPTSTPDVVSKKNGVIGRNEVNQNAPVDSRITMIVPDGRLYRETEFHVIVEKAEPLTTEL